MRRVSFALVFTALLLSFGLSNALNITGAFTGTYNELGTDYLGSGAPFSVTITAENTEDGRLGWSSPFHFYGTAGADGAPALAGVGTFTSNPAFDAIWDMGVFTYEESFDGDLTTGNTTLGPGEHYNYSGISMSGYNSGAPMLAFTFDFTMAVLTTDCALDYGTFCVAQGDMDNDTYDWLFEAPVPTFATVCFPVKARCNIPPEITNCPGTGLTESWDGNFLVDLDGNDGGDGGALSWSLESGPGAVDGDGVWTWSPDCGDVGSHTAVVGLFDGADLVTCDIDLTVTNQAPVIAGDCGSSFTIGTFGTNNALASFTATDVNGGTLTFGGGYAGPEFTATVNSDGTVDVVTTGATGVFMVDVTVMDCGGLTDACQFELEIISSLPFEIVIEKEHNVLQGHHVYIDVTKTVGSEEMHGFDFLIGYDASALTFMSAMPGVLFDMTGMYQWEYFTYRYNWNGNCGNGCPSGLLRVVGMAEQNDGPHNPLSVDVADGTVLFSLDFLVTNDRNFECMFVPINFYWMDCGDNVIAYHDKTGPMHEILSGLSKGVFMYNGNPFFEATDMYFGFPTWYGAQWECFEGEPDKPAPVPFVYFYGGGVDIICADSIDARGDMNLNGIDNEIADAVVLTNYFIYGTSAFTINVEGQIAASEINGDGMPLTVADLVYLIRIIVGDAMPLPKIAPASMDATMITANGVIRTDDVLGGALFTFAGNVDVTLAATNMDMMKDVRDGNTYVLIYSRNGESVTGNLLNTTSDPIAVEAATSEGGVAKVSVLPENFALNQNYPNPFNPKTSATAYVPVACDWTMDVYNIAGQRVMDFSGFSEAGKLEFDFSMDNYPSGVYFYKFEAGSFSKTMKMVLLK